MTDDDRDLRDRFAQLRDEDRLRVPMFRAPGARDASRSRWPVRIAVAAAIALVALVLVVLTGHLGASAVWNPAG